MMRIMNRRRTETTVEFSCDEHGVVSQLRPAAQASVAVQQFKLPDAAATIQILCVDR